MGCCTSVVTILSVEANYSNRSMCLLFSCSFTEFEYVNFLNAAHRNPCALELKG
jgi:hypothetical protein